MKAKKKRRHRFIRIATCLYRWRPTGLYYARINSRGKEITRSLGTSDRSFANQKLAELKRIHSALNSRNGNIVLAELVEKYRATFTHQKFKTREYKLIVTRRILDDWPTGALTTPVTRIRPSDCIAWLAKFHFGPSARNGHIRILRDMFELARQDGVIAENPAKCLSKARIPRPIRLTPTWEQFQAIVTNVRLQKFNRHGADASADFLEFLGLAGLGQAEASGLLRANVDLQAGRIVTFRHKTATGFTIPIYPQLLPLLAKVCEGKRHNDHLFGPKDAKKSLAAACDRLNLPRFSQRSFRRMFITRAIEKGVDVKVIAEWQGHKDGGKLILQTYSHVQPTHSQKMAQLMTFETL